MKPMPISSGIAFVANLPRSIAASIAMKLSRYILS
jgi:hypothetical protein